MKKHSLLWVFVLLSCFSLNLFAQQRDSRDAWAKYEAEKKSELLAGGLEALIPIVGHAYVGDAKRGVVPALVSAGGIALLLIGSTATLESGGTLTGYATVITLGYLVYLGGRIWGVVSAVNAAQEYNSNLKRKLNLSFNTMKFSQGKVGYGVTLSLNF